MNRFRRYLACLAWTASGLFMNWAIHLDPDSEEIEMVRVRDRSLN